MFRCWDREIFQADQIQRQYRFKDPTRLPPGNPYRSQAQDRQGRVAVYHTFRSPDASNWSTPTSAYLPAGIQLSRPGPARSLPVTKSPSMRL